jgi:hypothetical protein
MRLIDRRSSQFTKAGVPAIRRPGKLRARLTRATIGRILYLVCGVYSSGSVACLWKYPAGAVVEITIRSILEVVICKGIYE